MKLETIKKILKNPLEIKMRLASRNIIKMNDEDFLKLKFKLTFGKDLNIENPKTFNEKLQWLKLYDRNPEYTKMVDKYEAKKYVASLIGEEYIIPTIGLYEKFDDIDFDKLPNQFVMKCTHDSGGVVICKDKKKLSIKKTRKKLKKLMFKNFFYTSREWPYKNIKHRIIIEEYMKDKSQNDLNDYKFFCFNGVVRLILVCSNRNGSHKNTDFYDINWNLMPFTRSHHSNNSKRIKKPKNLNKMIEIAEKLSIDMPFVRVDLYEINEKIYFGELTFYPSGGFEGFKPDEWDRKIGDILELSKIMEDKK